MKTIIIRILSLPYWFFSIWKLKKRGSNPFARYAYYRKLNKQCSYIGINCKIDPNTRFPHGITGIFISGGASIGHNCTIYQHVTIGANEIKTSKHYGYPIIGDNVFIGANSTIIGNVHVGDNVIIGAGTVVTNDVPSNSTVVGLGARIISHGESFK